MKNRYKKIIYSLLVLAILFSPINLAFLDFNQNTIFANDKISDLREELLRLQLQILLLRLSLSSQGLNLDKLIPVQENCAQLVISWDAVPKANGYQVYRNNILVYEGNNRQFTDTGLTPKKTYKYTIYGTYQGQKGDVYFSERISAPEVCAPRIPTLTHLSNPCGGQITLIWNPDLNANIYELYRGNNKIYTGSQNRFIDNNLTPNREYSYKIKAGNSGGWSDFSDEIKAISSNVCAPTSISSSPVISEKEQSSTAKQKKEEAVFKISIRNNSNSINLRAGAKNQTLTSFGLWSSFSDIEISRFDLYFDEPAWQYFDKISLRYNGKTIETKELDRNSLTHIGNGVYRLRFQGFNQTVKVNLIRTISVIADIKENQPKENSEINLFLEQYSIRGIDEVSFTQFAPRRDQNAGLNSVFSRKINIR